MRLCLYIPSKNKTRCIWLNYYTQIQFLELRRGEWMLIAHREEKKNAFWWNYGAMPLGGIVILLFNTDLSHDDIEKNNIIDEIFHSFPIACWLVFVCSIWEDDESEWSMNVAVWVEWIEIAWKWLRIFGIADQFLSFIWV